MKGHEKEMGNMKETELNAHVRKRNADNLEEKNHENLSLLPLLICFSGSCGVYPCPNDSRFDLNTSWIDGLARMKYSSWIWGFLATWMTWKGKKGNDEDMERKGHERKWKDMKGCEGKWIEMKRKAMTTNKTNPPQRLENFTWSSFTDSSSLLGFYGVLPLPKSIGVGFAFVLSFSSKKSKRENFCCV